jgi:hypothetical protein
MVNRRWLIVTTLILLLVGAGATFVIEEKLVRTQAACPSLASDQVINGRFAPYDGYTVQISYGGDWNATVSEYKAFLPATLSATLICH